MLRTVRLKNIANYERVEGPGRGRAVGGAETVVDLRVERVGGMLDLDHPGRRRRRLHVDVCLHSVHQRQNHRACEVAVSTTAALWCAARRVYSY